MKLVSHRVGGRPRVGVVVDDGATVVDVAADMLDVIEHFDRPALEHVVAAAGPEARTPLDRVQLLPPVPRPSKIVGVVGNNDAIRASAEVVPPHPIYFVTAASALVAHGEAIEIREDYGLTHPEPELGIVIGRRARDIATADVPGVVFGYTVVNDITSAGLEEDDTLEFSAAGAGSFSAAGAARSLQFTYQGRSKGADTFKPCGPWLVTGDEFDDLDDVGVTLWMGEEKCLADRLESLTYSVAEVISHLSRYLTLEPGDIVHPGTAAQGRYKLRELDLQQWDGPCTIEITGVGRLSNPVRRTAAR